MTVFDNQKFVVANFKQSSGIDFFKNWIKKFKEEITQIKDLNINVVLCVPSPYLYLFKNELDSFLINNQKKIYIGAQNISSHSNLENTGEVSGEMLSEFVNFTLIGHSERKENFDEVSRKYQISLQNKIVPIVCFYENKSVYNLENCIFAYEDPNSISFGGEYKEKNFNDLVGIIQNLKDLFDGNPVLYGGSIRPENAQMIKDLNFFRGVLVGRSSLDPKSFVEIVKVFNN